MIRRIGTGLLVLALIAGGTAATAETPQLSIDTRQHPGAPLTVTDFKSYTESAGAFKFQHVVCISFLVRAAQPLASVKFAVSSRDADGKEYQHMTIERDGPFAPGADVPAWPSGSRKNCVEMNVLRSDAPLVRVRLEAATYADGTTWTAPEKDLPPRPVVAQATPSPQTAAPPPWSAASHAHYLAAAYGKGIAIFAPGHTVPSATLNIERCCAMALAFDGSGNLVAETSGSGILIFAPGATEPTRRIAGASGTTLAVDASGDIAAGGSELDHNVHIYPGGSEAAGYAVPARVPPGGLAFAPNGDLAVADLTFNRVEVYAPAATTVTRTIPVPNATRLVAYDAAGHLAVANADERTVTVFAPSADVSRVEVKGFVPQAIAFDSTGRLLVGTTYGVQPLDIGKPPVRALMGHAANALAADTNGTFAAGDTATGRVVLYSGDTRTVIGDLKGVRALAFSP